MGEWFCHRSRKTGRLPGGWRPHSHAAPKAAAVVARAARANRLAWRRSNMYLYLSKLFDWYREDFVSTAGSVPAFVARYAAPAYRAAVVAPGVRVAFLDYDWSLNGR